MARKPAVIVCRRSTPTVAIGQLEGQPDRQPDSLPQLPDDLLTRHDVNDDGEHPHPTLSHVLIHEHDVADVITTTGNRLFADEHG